MMRFQGPLDALLEKILELSPGEGFFKLRGKRLKNHRPIGTAARPETGFRLITLDLILHVLEKALLAGPHMLQSHGFFATALSLFLNALFDALPHEKGNARHGVLCLLIPIHGVCSCSMIELIVSKRGGVALT
jgi:hypothetical protein